ncbi:MAG: hypothetical protein AUG17_03895 [Crenarchaeota archaeon 13_1_20CM_2_53_14]|nr:MAG: hypothetical protein AUI07_06505 [archaeon 13_2_20CM_2_53_6]OLE59151.1 MAG: hypothetical protein AUG17_03895 [Crenarchaeota archaeon 13_1_20CM_2_53_14]TMI27231.1 MAG: hypothetical protein E6H24_01325 [Candidatus Bathyarchaeota archaeon]
MKTSPREILQYASRKTRQSTVPRAKTKSVSGDLSSFDGSRRLSNIELIKEYIRARGLNPEQILTRESLAEAAACTAGEELQDYQLRLLRNTFRDLVRKDIEETVQKPG